jgi:rhodanese-related sulfurtransferase
MAEGEAQKKDKQINKNIKPQEAFQMIKENVDNPNYIILDVRTPTEFSGGHVKCAKNVDYRAEDFQKQLENMDKNKKYLVYCGAGFRGLRAIKLMKKLDFMEVYNISGGFKKWNAMKLPVAEK